jgi:hypothetical protein
VQIEEGLSSYVPNIYSGYSQCIFQSLFRDTMGRKIDKECPRTRALLDWGEDVSNFISIHGVSWYKKSDNVMVKSAVVLFTIMAIIVLPVVVTIQSKLFYFIAILFIIYVLVFNK